MELIRFADIIDNYKAFFFDSYGVLKNQNGAISGVIDVINALNVKQIPYKILTNDASRNREEQGSKFRDLGYTGIRDQDIITSGMMTTIFLKEQVKSGLIAYLGTSMAADYIHQAGHESIPIHDVHDDNEKDISALVFLDDEGYNWDFAINKCINLLRHVNIPVVVANPDRIYPTKGNEVRMAIGSIAYMVEKTVGKRFIYFGKPESQMFAHAFDEMKMIGIKSKTDVLMIGDTLETDIYGANRFGLQSMLVLSGNTSKSRYENRINSTGIIPDYVCAELNWNID
ncbi:MAG: TIGR01459 family HAD-type hydrolase [Saprospiraceae bacterium]|nr:TIGR01459 family HAD-type hydrolase [Saprospiraceae bacterium]